MTLSGRLAPDRLRSAAQWYVTAAKQDDRQDVQSRALNTAQILATILRTLEAAGAKMREHELPHEVP
jgi:hypothetical protein